jgi:D-glycero-alpha-D-manno-heptose 1-phosphate guanylyltransferase
MKQINWLVLAGGFGTRLRSVVSEVPKPLAPVLDRPYLHYLIESWIAQGVTSLTFLLHHQADMVATFLQGQKKAGHLRNCELRIVTEPQPMGTGGAVAYAVRELGMEGSFLVTNADTWLGAGIAQIWETEAPAMAIVHVDNCERYGSVRTEKDKVIAFEEKQHSAGSGWINAGLYHLQADYFRNWNEQPFSLERELFPDLVEVGSLTAVPLETDFIDIGIPHDYFRFCSWIESGKAGAL